jgi:hypothetical protein
VELLDRHKLPSPSAVISWSPSKLADLHGLNIFLFPLSTSLGSCQQYEVWTVSPILGLGGNKRADSRYLEENLTPEWRRAYIDYKGCKKRIKIIDARLRSRGSPQIAPDGVKVNESANDSSDNDGDHGPAAPPKKATPSLRANSARSTGTPQTPKPRDVVSLLPEWQSVELIS